MKFTIVLEKATPPTTTCGESPLGSYHWGGTFEIVSARSVVKLFLSINRVFLLFQSQLDIINSIANNAPNITVTPLNNAQPWRFFYACSGGIYA